MQIETRNLDCIRMPIVQFIKKLCSVDIVKVFSLNAISTFIRMLTGMVSVKIVASIIGPAGVAIVGQLNNLVSILLGVANGGISSGVTKYVAEYRDDNQMMPNIMSNALRITVICSLMMSFVLIIGHRYFSQYVLLSDEYGYVFVVFGFTIIFYTLNGLLISILNGYKRFKKFVVVNISGTLIGLLFSVSLVVSFGLAGALINAVTFQSVIFFITLYLLRKETWLIKDNFTKKYDPCIVRMFLGYSAMTILSLALLPVSQMLLRGYVISQISIVEAGWWEGMNRISQMYLSVITTSLSVYYLPKLSETRNSDELRAEIFRVYKFIAPILFIATLCIYILRHFIVWLLYTPSFYPMEDLFACQLIGDFFKIMSWILAYQMIAKSQTKIFIVTEIFFTVSYLLLSYAFIRINGIVGLTQGYMFNYIIYTLAMIVIYKNLLIKKNE